MNERLRTVWLSYHESRSEAVQRRKLLSQSKTSDERKSVYGSALLAVGTGIAIAGSQRDNRSLKRIGLAVAGTGAYVNYRIGMKADLARHHLRNAVRVEEGSLSKVASRAKEIWKTARK